MPLLRMKTLYTEEICSTLLPEELQAIIMGYFYDGTPDCMTVMNFYATCKKWWMKTDSYVMMCVICMRCIRANTRVNEAMPHARLVVNITNFQFAIDVLDAYSIYRKYISTEVESHAWKSNIWRSPNATALVDYFKTLNLSIHSPTSLMLIRVASRRLVFRCGWEVGFNVNGDYTYDPYDANMANGALVFRLVTNSRMRFYLDNVCRLE